jgi:uncharacterized protein
MKRRTFSAAVAGAALALTGVVLLDTARDTSSAVPASTRAIATAMMPVPIDPTWVRSGTPKVSMNVTAVSPDGRTVSGLWACEGPTTFEWHFGTDETVVVLEGGVEIDYLGQRFTLRAGDSATFRAGTTAVWHVPERVKKMFTLQRASLPLRAWRRVARAFD